MKKQLFSLQGFLLLTLIAIFTSCGLLDGDEIEVNPVFDCPDIQAMVGDSCLSAAGVIGAINADCAC
ncbi:MAG: hypothetical protein AB8H12_24605, partial [Lewinella sp.]